MKVILFFISLVIGVNQKNEFAYLSYAFVNTNFNGTLSPQSSSITWRESLSDFRKALLNVDIKSVKGYFAFPIMNPGNDIWMVADMKNATRMAPNKIVPFKESDLDQHFSSIFAIDFRKTFEEIDIEKLATTGLEESPELKILPPATSKMKAVYSETKKTIILSLITKSPEFGQYSIDYHFKISTSSEVRFTHVKFNI